MVVFFQHLSKFIGLVRLEELRACSLFSISVRASVFNQSASHSITRKQLKIVYVFSKTDDIRFA